MLTEIISIYIFYDYTINTSTVIKPRFVFINMFKILLVIIIIIIIIIVLCKSQRINYIVNGDAATAGDIDRMAKRESSSAVLSPLVATITAV